MEKSNHYYATYFLMRALTFSPWEARRVAYASQYTDDSVESDPIELDSDYGVFNPVRTAHYGLSISKRKLRSLALNIWMPFHFLPGGSGKSDEEKLMVKPASPLAKDLLNNALTAFKKPYMHHALGIAIHSFLDTFSHRDFSGRWGKENEVSNLETGIDIGDVEEWKKEYFDHSFQNLIKIAPRIGHAEAAVFPDLPFLTWEYVNWKNKKKTRSNPDDFLKGFKILFMFLADWMGMTRAEAKRVWDGQDKKPLSGVGGVLTEAFSSVHIIKKSRYKAWKDLMAKQKVFNFCKADENRYLKYDEETWFDNAIYTEDANTRMALSRAHGRRSRKPVQMEAKAGFFNSDFYHFHVAARKQRLFVKKWLKDNDLKP